MKGIGWILDVYIDGRKAVLWVKLENGEAIRVFDDYIPDFYVKLEEECDCEQICQTISTHPCVSEVEVEEKYTSIPNRRKDRVLRIFFGSSKGL